MTDIVAEISVASQEQTSGIDQVNKAVMEMDQSTQQNFALGDLRLGAGLILVRVGGVLRTDT